MNRLTTTIMICALAFGYPLANATSPKDDVPSVIVRFADIDLAHGNGASALYRRLKGAARTVCALQNGRDIGRQMRFRSCWQAALSTAVAKVDQPALTAYYRAQFNGHSAPSRIAKR